MKIHIKLLLAALSIVTWHGVMPAMARACTAPVVQQELAKVDAALPAAKLTATDRERVLTMRARAANLLQIGQYKGASRALDGPMGMLALPRVPLPDGRKCS